MNIDASKKINLIPDDIQKKLNFIHSKITDLNGEIYLIGGSVRDLVIGQTPKEYDLTTSLEPTKLKSIFKRVIDTGIQHGTVTVMLGETPFEITTYRKDIDYIDGRRPEKVEFGISLEEDMKRRDFTMNSIALDLNSKCFVDYNNGIQDIESKLIRTIGNPVSRFSEDGLRPIRAIRFHSTLNFKIEEETYSAIYTTREITKKISRERFHDELNKILLSDFPDQGINILTINKIFELFIDKSSIEYSSNEMSTLSKNILGLRLSYMIRKIYGSNLGIEEIQTILYTLKYSKQNSNDTLLFYLIQNFEFEDLNEILLRKFLSFVLTHTKEKELLKIYIKETYSLFSLLFPKEKDWVIHNLEKIIQSNLPLSIKDLQINGNTLSKSFPSIDKKIYGEILRSCLDLVLKEPNQNTENELNSFIKKKYLINS
jgi:tRNA nucleotidyltransferase/poly(A) polymerase